MKWTEGVVKLLHYYCYALYLLIDQLYGQVPKTIYASTRRTHVYGVRP